MKKLILLIFLSKALVFCTHREFLADDKVDNLLKLTSDQKACMAKGIRWQWVDEKGCLVRDFLGYCQLEHPPKSIAKVITYLKNEVNLKDCSEANEALQSLPSLYLSNYQIQDIYPLVAFTQLKILLLDHNQITDLFPLANMRQLRVLRLDENKIRDISILKNLQNLVVLRLDHNEIEEVSPLVSMNKLAQVNLNQNRIKDATPLSEIVSLRKLGLRDNLLEDISPLSHLPNLEFLDVEGNPIASSRFKKTHQNCPHGVDTPEVIKAICQNKKS